MIFSASSRLLDGLELLAPVGAEFVEVELAALSATAAASASAAVAAAAAFVLAAAALAFSADFVASAFHQFSIRRNALRVWFGTSTSAVISAISIAASSRAIFSSSAVALLLSSAVAAGWSMLARFPLFLDFPMSWMLIEEMYNNGCQGQACEERGIRLQLSFWRVVVTTTVAPKSWPCHSLIVGDC